MDMELAATICEDITPLNGQLLDRLNENVRLHIHTENTKKTQQDHNGGSEAKYYRSTQDFNGSLEFVDLKESEEFKCVASAEKTLGEKWNKSVSYQLHEEDSQPQCSDVSTDGHNILDRTYTQKFLQNTGSKIMNYVFKDQDKTIHVRCYAPNSVSTIKEYSCSCSIGKMNMENMCKHIQLLKNSITTVSGLPVEKMDLGETKSPSTMSCKCCSHVFKDSVSLANHEALHTSTKELAKKTRYMCVVCGKLYTKQRALGLHMKCHASEPSPCSHCSKVFMSKAMLNAHLNIHGVFPYKCSKCSKTFVLEPLLNKHLATEHQMLKEKTQLATTTKLMSDIHTRSHNRASDNKRATLKCDVCPKVFTTQLRLDIHKRSHINNCSVCGKYFSTRYGVKKHERIHKNTSKTNTCHVCGRGFFSPCALKKHLRIHSGVKFVCEVCGMSFTTQKYLHKHQSVHSDHRPFVCEVCGAAFKRRNYLNSHMRGVHRRHIGPPLDPCTVCGEMLKFKESKAEHMRLHTEYPLKCTNTTCGKNFRTVRAVLIHEKYAHMNPSLEGPFACDLCTNSYHSVATLNAHRKFVHALRKKYTHTSSGPHTCDQCGKTYTFLGGLQFHKRMMHTLNKERAGMYNCDKCDKSYTYKMSLYQHMKTVHECGSYPCKLCSKVFTNKVALYYHAAVHSDERPYSCVVCNKAYKRASALATHVTIHSGVKPFKCNFCEKLFRRKNFLQSHLRTHTKEKPFSCEICGKVFSQAGDRNRHRKKFHGFPVGKKVDSITVKSTH